MKGSETHESLEIPGEMKKTAIARGFEKCATDGTWTRMGYAIKRLFCFDFLKSCHFSCHILEWGHQLRY